jgi:putative transposase
MTNTKRLKIPLPDSWSLNVKSAVLHAISLAQFAMAYTRGWAANSINARIRLKGRVAQLEQMGTCLTEQMRIKDARLQRIDPQKRPHYLPVERMAILELRAAQNWSLKLTAKAFLVTRATIRSWLARIEEGGPDALVQLARPVNRFSDCIRYLVQRLKTLCPLMGKKKMADVLARAGLHLGVTTVGRILKEKPLPRPKASEDSVATDRVFTAKRPNHVWHTDLTAVPIGRGFFTTWFPFALPQCWPFCWWVAVVVDHYSRRVMGYMIFRRIPSSRAVQKFLDRTIQKTGQTPKYIISDKGKQFWCDGFKDWCSDHGIKPRFGAVGKHGSIAVVERLILTLKNECTRRLIRVPSRRRNLREELARFVEWYNEWRPHEWLSGATPNEIYFKRRPANRLPRFEPRARWPRPSPCAAPRTLVKGQPGVQLALKVRYHAGRKHLPIVTLRRAA